MAEAALGAVGLYAVETAAEASVVGAYFANKPSLPLTARFQKFHLPSGVSIPRSSHSVSVVNGKTYIFGGEIEPRKPVDNAMHVLSLPEPAKSKTEEEKEVTYTPIPAVPSIECGRTPEARVGHTASVLGQYILVFGGRGGPNMSPLDENGGVWCYDTLTSKWTLVEPTDSSPRPEARSYHAATAVAHIAPRGQDNVVELDTQPSEVLSTVIPKLAAETSTETPSSGTLFIHAGCPAKGRTSDLWAFDFASRSWLSFPQAPDPPRGGTSIAYAGHKLWRFGGFNGTNEIGGTIDFLEIGNATAPGSGTLGLAPMGEWTSIDLKGITQEKEGNTGPLPRSVAGFQTLNTGYGREYIILFFGERDPSDKGHEGAGKFWDDVWAFQVDGGVNAATAKDKIRETFGADNYARSWARCDVVESAKTVGDIDLPEPRGWFASSQAATKAGNGIVFWGGLNGKNERLSDGYLMTFQ